MTDTIELYTCRLERTVSIRSARIAIVVSAQRGSVEDVNTGLQRIVDALRTLQADAEKDSELV